MSANILAPSYGKIIEVKAERGDRGYYWHISTFLGVLDNHDQFIPYSGTCVASNYKEGQFHGAHLLGKSDKNERWETVFETEFGLMVVTQIAGLIARRIRNNCKIGQRYAQGWVYGEILLGSRVDITLPVQDIQINCRKGEELTGGKTAIAIYNKMQQVPKTLP